MDRDGQLDHAEPGAEVAAGDRHGRNHFLAKLVGELRQLLLVERADVGGRGDRVEQRRVRVVRTSDP